MSSKVFFSYSLNWADEFIVSKLAEKLSQQGYIMEASRNMMSNVLDFATYTALTKSDLFIGVMTIDGNRKDMVWKEYELAITQNIPRVLFVEDRFDTSQLFDPNIFIFNRHNTDPTLKKIEGMLNVTSDAQSANSSAVPLILGGAAILGLIALLSDDTDTKVKKKGSKKKTKNKY